MFLSNIQNGCKTTVKPSFRVGIGPNMRSWIMSMVVVVGTGKTTKPEEVGQEIQIMDKYYLVKWPTT